MAEALSIAEGNVPVFTRSKDEIILLWRSAHHEPDFFR